MNKIKSIWLNAISYDSDLLNMLLYIFGPVQAILISFALFLITNF